VKGCVTLWRQSCLTPPPSPSLLASWEIADRHPNQTICPTRDSCHVLTEIAGQPGTDFSPTGGKEYTVHSIQYTVQTFSWLLLSFAAESSASGPQSGKAPYHSLTLPHLFYLYSISVVKSRTAGRGQCGMVPPSSVGGGEGEEGVFRHIIFVMTLSKEFPVCFTLFEYALE
jgi:hypothetical protein